MKEGLKFRGGGIGKGRVDVVDHSAASALKRQPGISFLDL